MNVLFDPNPYCFGSTSTMRAIRAALPPGASVRVLAIGPVHDLCRDLDAIDHDVRDPAALKARADLLDWADVYVAISNNTNVEVVHRAAVPLVFIDILYWMKRRETPAMRWADAYLIEGYPGVDERLAALPVPGARRVGPILHRVDRSAHPAIPALVNIGGAASPDLLPGVNTTYPRQIMGLMELLRARRSWPTLEVAMGSAAAASAGPVGSTHPVTLPQDEYLRRLGQAQVLLTAPGLNAPLEAFLAGVSVAWLPPQNLTQVFHLRAYVEAGLAPANLTLEALVPGFSADPRRPEAEGTKVVLDALASLGDRGWQDVFERVEAELDAAVQPSGARVERARAWLDALGQDGAMAAAQVIAQVAR
jgi:hypothetical protein